MKKGKQIRYNPYHWETGTWTYRPQTKVIGWNCGVGFTKSEHVTKSDNFIYGVRDSGIFKIDPYSGKSVNIVENSGAIARYWETLDSFYSTSDLHAGRKNGVYFNKREGGRSE